MSLNKTKQFVSKTNKNPFLTIPYQSFEIENTYILPPQTDFKERNYVQLCYKDSSVELHDLPILTPPLKVHHYDIKKSMLFLEIDTNHSFYQKISLLQEFIVQAFYNYQNLLFPQLFDNTSCNLSNELKTIKIFLSSSHAQSCQSKHIPLSVIRSYFQFPLRDNMFGLYIHPNTEIKISDNQTPIQAYQLVPGTYIRSLLRFYNIFNSKSNINNKNYLRIHHSVPTIWYVGPPKILSRMIHHVIKQPDSEKCMIIA